MSRKHRTTVLRVDIDGFVAFIGHGYNALGRFPATLTELNDALYEYAARRTPPEDPTP